MADQSMPDLIFELRDEIANQDAKHGRYGVQGGTELGIGRLAIATLEDEVEEVRQAWREERRVDGWNHTRAECLQVAAVAIRAIRDAFPYSERQRQDGLDEHIRSLAR